MTGPGAEEEIEEYGEHYCPRCNSPKWWGNRLCDDCAVRDGSEGPPHGPRPMPASAPVTKWRVKVKAWRSPNEDGADRPTVLLHKQWDGSWSLAPLKPHECFRCYPRCYQPMGHRDGSDRRTPPVIKHPAHIEKPLWDRGWWEL